MNIEKMLRIYIQASIYKTVFIILLVFVFSSCVDNTETMQDDYKIYSILIDTDLSKFNPAWTLNGYKVDDKFFPFAEGKIERINVVSKTFQPEKDSIPENNVNEIPRDLYENFLKKNQEQFLLESKFNSNTQSALFTEREEKVLREEATKNGTHYDEYVKSIFPTTTGWLMFSRVSFNSTRDKALVSAIFYIIDPRKGYSGGSLNRTVLMTKNANNWVVEKFFFGRESIIVNLEKCESVAKSYAWGMGSGSTFIGGLKDGKCHIGEFHEVEGGYTRTECYLPTDLGEIEIYNFGTRNPWYSQDLSAFCEKPKGGNLLIEQQEQLRKNEN